MERDLADKERDLARLREVFATIEDAKMQQLRRAPKRACNQKEIDLPSTPLVVSYLWL